MAFAGPVRYHDTVFNNIAFGDIDNQSGNGPGRITSPPLFALVRDIFSDSDKIIIVDNRPCNIMSMTSALG